MHQPESVIPQSNRQALFGYLFVLLGAFGFSAKAVLVKLAYSYSLQLDAITLMVLRMADFPAVFSGGCVMADQ